MLGFGGWIAAVVGEWGMEAGKYKHAMK